MEVHLSDLMSFNHYDIIAISGPSQNHGGHPDRDRLQGHGHARRSEGPPPEEPGTPPGRPEVRAGRATPRGQQVHREHQLGAAQDAADAAAGVLRRSDEGIFRSGCVKGKTKTRIVVVTEVTVSASLE